MADDQPMRSIWYDWGNFVTRLDIWHENGLKYSQTFTAAKQMPTGDNNAE